MLRSGRHDAGVYLDVASGFATDTASTVIEAIANRLDGIGEILVAPGDRARYQAWIRTHFGQQLTALGLPGDAKDDDDMQVRRATLLELVGITGNDSDLQKRSQELTAQYLKDSRALPATLAPTVLEVAALNGDRALYDQYVAKLGTLAAQPEEYYRFFNALPMFKDPALSKRTLEFALSPAVRTQDTGTLIGSMMAKSWSQDMTWEFVKSNWQTIVKTLGQFQGIPSIVESTGSFCSASRAHELRAFFEKNPVASSQRAAQQAIERVETCAALKERQSKPLAAWIAAK
jgi:aminopeptidase N